MKKTIYVKEDGLTFIGGYSRELSNAVNEMLKYKNLPRTYKGFLIVDERI
jgi:hypothetical protein